MKVTPIKDAERIGTAADAVRVAILTLDNNGRYAWTTWGRSRADCQAMKRWGEANAEAVLWQINETS